MVEYPECKKFKGKEKVVCLIGAIQREYQDGKISRELAIRRINYLIALNKRHKWMSQREVERLVEKAIRELEGEARVKLEKPKKKRKGGRRMARKRRTPRKRKKGRRKRRRGRKKRRR